MKTYRLVQRAERSPQNGPLYDVMCDGTAVLEGATFPEAETYAADTVGDTDLWFESDTVVMTGAQLRADRVARETQDARRQKSVQQTVIVAHQQIGRVDGGVVIALNLDEV